MTVWLITAGRQHRFRVDRLPEAECGQIFASDDASVAPFCLACLACVVPPVDDFTRAAATSVRAL